MFEPVSGRRQAGDGRRRCAAWARSDHSRRYSPPPASLGGGRRDRNDGGFDHRLRRGEPTPEPLILRGRRPKRPISRRSESSFGGTPAPAFRSIVGRGSEPLRERPPAIDLRVSDRCRSGARRPRRAPDGGRDVDAVRGRCYFPRSRRATPARTTSTAGMIVPGIGTGSATRPSTIRIVESLMPESQCARALVFVLVRARGGYTTLL